MSMTFADWQKKNSRTANAAGQTRSAAQPQAGKEDEFAKWQTANRPELLQTRQNAAQRQYERRATAARTASQPPEGATGGYYPGKTSPQSGDAALRQAAREMAAERQGINGWDIVAENQRKAQKTYSGMVDEGAKRLGATLAGTAANFESGYGSFPLWLTARAMEVPDDVAYWITKDERFNLDNPETNPGGRDSDALRQADDFRTFAEEMQDSTGKVGDLVISGGQAAGNMMSAAGTMGYITNAANATGLTSSLQQTYAPLSQASTAVQNAARMGVEVLTHPGNVGVSLSSALNSYDQALKNGASFDQATVNGIYKGLAEYFSNKMFSGTPFEDLGGEEKGYVTRLSEFIAKKLGKAEALQAFNKSVGGKAFNWIFDKAGEGFEEVLTGIADPLIDRATYDADADLFTLESLTDEFLGGITLSLLMGGGEALINNASRQGARAPAATPEQAALAAESAQETAPQTRKGTDSTPPETRAEAREAEARETAAETVETTPAEGRTKPENGYTFSVDQTENGQYVMRVTDSDGAVQTETFYADEATAREAAEGLRALWAATATEATAPENSRTAERTNRRTALRAFAEEKGFGEAGTQGLLSNAPDGVDVDAYAKEYQYYYDQGVLNAQNNPNASMYDASDFLDVKKYAETGGLPESVRVAAFQDGRRDVKQAQSDALEAEAFSGAGLHPTAYRYFAETLGLDRADQLNEAAKRLGVEVRAADLVSRGNANAEIRGIRFTENDKIKINRNIVLIEKGNPNPIYKLLGHEWMHRVQDLDSKAYREFVESIPKADVDRLTAKVKKTYEEAGIDITPEHVVDEAAADYAGEMLADGNVLDEWIDLNRDNRTLLQRFADWIKSLFNKVGKQERQQLDAAHQKLLDALKAAEIAAREPGAGTVVLSEKAALEADMNSESNAAEAEEAAVKHSLVTDEDLRRRLEGGETITVYRAMQLIDGKLYPPMAAKVAEEAGKGKKRQLVEPTQLGEWYQSDERPELADETGMFTLDKGNGSTIKARYNPYFHTSATPLNDQFSSAWNRPNLVTVEAEIPASELTSGYKAERAKDAVGEVQWHSGPVASQLKGDKARRVFLSRWTKVTRIMSDAEVARIVAQTLDGENVAVPANVVTPSLLAELEKQGVRISAEALYKGKNLAEDKSVYSYDFLTKLPAMTKTELPATKLVLNQSGRVDTSAVVAQGMKNARTVGTERGGKVYVRNDYTGRELRVDNSSIRHGLDGGIARIRTNARLGAVIGDIVQRAVPINALYTTAKDATGTYAMAAYAYDDTGREYIAIVTVEQRSGNVDGIEVYDVAHAISGRQKRSSQADTKSQGVYPIKAAKVSIAQLIDVVNSTHQSILSNDVLSHLGETRNPSGQYAGKVRFSLKSDADYLAAVERGDMETAQRMVDEAAEAAGYTQLVYRGGGQQHNVFDTTRGSGSTQYGPGTYFTDAEGLAFDWARDRAHDGDDGFVGKYYIQTNDFVDDRSVDADAEEWKNVESKLREYGVTDRYIKIARAYGFAGIARALQTVGKIDDGKYAAYDWKNATVVNRLLREAGYKGIVGDFYDSLQYVIFDPTQAKSADPVTYDDNGNVIPLSERFNPEKQDIRYSLKTDSEGRELTQGQREYFKDSKAVDEDGRLLKLYHGGSGRTVYEGRGEGFTYNPNSIYLTDSEEIARAFAGRRGTVQPLYADLRNPLILDAQGRSYTDIPLPDDAPESLRDFFWADGTADADNLPVYAERNGYDGIIIRNVREGVGGSPATEVIALRSEQVKSVDNKNPTRNVDIRFSMKSPVEETQTLIALHNLNAEKLGKALDLGGFPMPSIAVTKTSIPHTNFGDITLVMSRSTIDPQADRRNTVYSADAWTPTFPSIEYEADEKAAAALRKRYYEMRKRYGDEATRPLYPWGNYADDELTRRGGIKNVIEGYRDDLDMMKLYLLENGIDVPAPVVEETVSRLDDETVAFYDHFISALGKDAFEELYSRDGESPIDTRKRWWAAHGDEFNDAYKAYMLGLGFSAEEIDNVLENESVASQTRKAVEMRNYLRNGAEKRTTATNVTATNDAIRAVVDAEKYNAWLHGLFDGLEKSSGIYNGRERYTPSGNERSFSATHYAVTLENIARAMASENNGNSRNVDGFYGVKSLRAGMAKRFSSIAEMHEYEGRLQHLSEDEAQQITDALSDRMTAIMGKVYDTKAHGKYDNSFVEMDRIGDMLMEITEQRRITVDSVEKVFAQYGYKIGNELAVDIRNLLFDVAQMPVNIFEAKPERAVRFDEVLAAVVPSGTDAYLVRRLEDAGVQSVLEYEKGNDADRMAKANSVEGARFSLKSPSETPTVTQLLRENERLAERVDYFKGQLRLTKEWTADDKRVRQLTRSLLDEFDAAAQLDSEARAALTADLREIVEYAHRGTGDADYEARLRDMTYGVARTLVQNARVLSESSDVQLFNEVRRRLREPMILDARYAHDISPDNWGEWRRANRGKVNVSINGKGIPVDTAYQELSEAYPWLFPAEVSNPADQVLQMIEAVDTLTPVFENPYSSDMAYAVDFAANAVLESVMDDALQAAPTFADRKAAQIQQERKANWEYTQEMLRRVRAKRDEQIRAIMDYNKESQRRRAERREDSEARTRLLKIAKRLQNKKLPAVTRALLDQYIGDLDTVAKSITGAKLEELSALRDWYEQQKATDPDFIADPATEKKLERLHKRHIKSLTAVEVAELTEILLNIENEINQERRIIDSEDRRDTRQMVLESIYNVEETHGSKKNLADWIADNTLSPLRLLRRLTGYVDTDPLYQRTRELADGQRRMLDYQMRAERLFSKWANDTRFIERIRRKERIKITALEHGVPVEVEITPDMRMALYLHSLNDQNLRHIAKGGVTIPDIDIYLKGDLKEAYSRGRTVVLSPSNIRAICDKMSEAEKAYARAAHDYFNGMSRDEVNATSEKLVGYSIAGVEHYFPIETDRNFTKANIDELKRDGTIEGMGFLKERVNASNAINLVPMTDVLKRSIQNHAKYVGLAVPVRNFGKIWGMNAQNDVAGESNGLRKAVSTRWGSRGVDAIENMITDLQSAYKRADDLDKLFSRIRSNYAGAVLSLNLSVALKQAASYPTAAAVLGWKPLAQAMKDFGRVDLERVAKYTPLQWYRSQGYSTQELGDIKARQGLMDKVLNAKVRIGGKDVPLLNWIQSVDLLTTRKLWKSSEYYVRDNNKELKIGSEEYYRAVADVYNRVIEETQPNYTTMQRPQLLRSQNGFAELFGMFKTQPFQNFNVLYDAIGELRAAQRLAKNGDDSKLKAAKKNAANAVSSQIVQLAVFAAMTMLYGLARGRDDKWRDKEGELSPLSMLTGVAKDMLSGAASMIPVGSDLYNVIESAITGGKYYGASSATVSAISDALSAISKAGSAISKAVSEPESINYSTLGKTMENLVLETSKALGVPAENVRNDVQIIMRGVLLAKDGQYIGGYEYIRLTENMESSYVKGDVYDLLYRAYQTDPAAHRELYRQMVKDGFKPDSIKTAMEKRMKETQGVKSVNDLKKRYSAP